VLASGIKFQAIYANMHDDGSCWQVRIAKRIL